MNHTPGPWEKFPTDGKERPGEFTVWLGEFELPCIAKHILTEADADLIAAAPELLKGLKKGVQRLRAVAEVADQIPLKYAVMVLKALSDWEEIEKTIEKATGES